MRFVPPPGAPAPDLKGATLVIPAVAFANVGELAVDAIVATLRLPLAARGDDPNVLPSGGHGAYDHLPASVLATSLELYGGGGGGASTSSKNLFVLQQRAPAVPGRQRAFAEAAAKAAKEGGAARVLLLCGLDAAWRRERQIDDAAAHPLRTVVVGNDSTSSTTLAKAASEAANALPLEDGVEADEREAGAKLPPWTLLDAFAAEGVAATLLCCFVSEGDNAPHGLALAAAALRTLSKAGVVVGGGESGKGGGGEEAASVPAAFDAATATPAQLRTPRSWVGLYGRPPVRALY